MNREQYLAKRNELYTQAKGLIENGELDKADELMEEIKNLDAEFEKQSKAAANLAALENTGIAAPITNQIVNTGNLISNGLPGNGTSPNENVENEESYHDAFLNYLMGNELSNEQQDVFKKFNLGTKDTEVVIPKQTASKIWEEAEKHYPFYAKTLKTNVKGSFELIQEDESSDAAFYEEGDETESGTETFKTFILSGCELSRCIDVSWKLKEMSMEDFENYIVRKMAKKMGEGAATAVMQGKGKPGKDETFKPEPNGVVTVLKAETGTPQIVEYTDVPTYDNITELFSKIKSSYKKEIYARNTYIWNTLAKIVDKTGKPYFIADTTKGGVGMIFGAPVYEDDSVPEDTCVCGDATLYQTNFNKSITLDTEEQKKKHITSYIGYAILDGAPITNKAFAILTKKVVTPASK